MRILVTSLLKSIPALVNVVVFLAFIFMIFGIIGVQLWAGVLNHRCRFTEGPVKFSDGGIGDFDTGCRDSDSPACMERILTVDVDDIPQLTDSVYSPTLGMTVSDIVNTTALIRCDGPPANATWSRTYDCFWPIDLTDTSVCSLGTSGQHKCAAGRWCGSHFDSSGNRRFSNDDTQRMDTFIEDLSFGYTRFDNIGLAFVAIFQSITMEGWTVIMYQLQDSSNAVVPAIYFIILILFGSFFLLNLTLAVIWDAFNAEQQEEQARKELRRAEKDLAAKTKTVRQLEAAIAALNNTSASLGSTAAEHVQATTKYGVSQDRLVEDVPQVGSTRGTSTNRSICVDTVAEQAVTRVDSVLVGPDRTADSDSTNMYVSASSSALHVPREPRKSQRVSDASAGLSQTAAIAVSSSTHATRMGRPSIAITVQPTSMFTNVAGGTVKTTRRSFVSEALDAERIPPPATATTELDHLSFFELEQDVVCSMHTIVVSHVFRSLVVGLILINTIILACDYYPMKQSVAEPLEIISFVLTVLFSLEMVMKIIGLGAKGYVADIFNVFDGFIVVVSLVELVIIPPGFTTPETGDAGGSGAISALRTFRLLRIFKLARSWRSLNSLLKTIVRAIQDIGSFSVLLLLFMYIFALVGMQFFASQFCFDDNTGLPYSSSTTDCPDGFERPRSHFDNLLWSFVTVFQVLTGTCSGTAPR